MFKKRNFIFGLVLIAFIYSCNRSVESDAEIIYQFKEFELFTLAYGRPLQSFHIDSTGKILELVKNPNEIRIYSYHLDGTELDSLMTFLSLSANYEEPADNLNNGCVDGVSYKMTIDAKGKINSIENAICDDKTIVDEMVLYLLNTTENKNKKMLFKNYVEYEKFIKDAYLILNLEQ